MTTRIDVELDDQEVRQRLAVLMRSVTDTLPVMRGIAAELLAETEFAFMDEGPGWPQLSPATVAAREAKGAWSPPDPPGHKRLGSLGHDLGGSQRGGNRVQPGLCGHPPIWWRRRPGSPGRNSCTAVSAVRRKRPTGGRRSAVHSRGRPYSPEPKSVVGHFRTSGTLCLLRIRHNVPNLTSCQPQRRGANKDRHHEQHDFRPHHLPLGY